MKLLYFSLLLISSLLYIVNTKEELLLVVEVSRHGARAPGKIFPFAKDPLQNYDKTSELTSLGKK